jgi:hypothetical protein
MGMKKKERKLKKGGEFSPVSMMKSFELNFPPLKAEKILKFKKAPEIRKQKRATPPDSNILR